MAELLFAGRSGEIYNAGSTGGGSISIINAPLRGLDENLFRILCVMVDELAVSLTILSVDTGGHVPTSRHYHGRAVDITRVAGLDVQFSAAQAVPLGRVTHWLRSHAFGPGEDGCNGVLRCLLFGPAESEGNRSNMAHLHHLHVSIGVAG